MGSWKTFSSRCCELSPERLVEISRAIGGVHFRQNVQWLGGMSVCGLLEQSGNWPEQKQRVLMVIAKRHTGEVDRDYITKDFEYPDCLDKLRTNH